MIETSTNFVNIQFEHEINYIIERIFVQKTNMLEIRSDGAPDRYVPTEIELRWPLPYNQNNSPTDMFGKCVSLAPVKENSGVESSLIAIQYDIGAFKIKY